jgi:hypothetical protein
MSGVLQRLAARVFPAPCAVRPRLGSRFEGFSAAAEPGAMESEARHAQAAAGSGPGQPARAPGRPATAPASDPAAPEPGLGAGVPEVRGAPEPLLPPLAAGRDAVPGARAPVAQPPSPSSALPVAVIAEAGPDAAPVPDGRPRPILPDAPPQALPFRSGSSTENAKSAATGRRREAPAPALMSRSDPSTENAKEAATEGRRDAPLLPPRPPGAAAFHDLPAPVPAAPAAPAAPDIQVSIGRIEIRADRNEASPPRRAPPRPALMSLEDYLGKGRGRR